jgi:hypothetical protein
MKSTETGAALAALEAAALDGPWDTALSRAIDHMIALEDACTAQAGGAHMPTPELSEMPEGLYNIALDAREAMYMFFVWMLCHRAARLRQAVEEAAARSAARSPWPWKGLRPPFPTTWRGSLPPSSVRCERSSPPRTTCRRSGRPRVC